MGLFLLSIENFAYRYLETSKNKNIKCIIEEPSYRVESVEPKVLEALKWENPELKKSLIELCKKYPGKQSQEIQLKLILETGLIDSNKVQCQASIKCVLPNGDIEILSESKTDMTFEDPIELRNKHAALLEKVSEIF